MSMYHYHYHYHYHVPCVCARVEAAAVLILAGMMISAYRLYLLIVTALRKRTLALTLTLA